MRASGRRVGNGECDRAQMERRTDAELLRDLQLPEGGALEEFLRRYRPLVYRVALKILRDVGEAEDATQEIVFELYTKAGRYDPAKGTVKTWLFQYAYHRSFRRKAALHRCAAYRECSVEVLSTSRGACAAGLARQECVQLVEELLRNLSPAQSAAVNLVYSEGLSLYDVAERLQIPWGRARHHYYRGLANLRRLFRAIRPSRGYDSEEADQRARLERAREIPVPASIRPTPGGSSRSTRPESTGRRRSRVCWYQPLSGDRARAND